LGPVQAVRPADGRRRVHALPPTDRLRRGLRRHAARRAHLLVPVGSGAGDVPARVRGRDVSPRHRNAPGSAEGGPAQVNQPSGGTSRRGRSSTPPGSLTNAKVTRGPHDASTFAAWLNAHGWTASVLDARTIAAER